MEDADLFMECEEEELEPWQQLNQNQLDESSGTAGSKTSTGAVAVENPALSKPVVISSLPPASNNMSTVPLLTNTLPTTAPAGISKSAPGQQLILAQGAGGLTPVALSQVILPGSSAATSQPIYLTTQGIPVQNIQSGQSPMSIVLNVQQGQAVRPITLVQAPGTPGIFKPAVRTAQIITQQAPMRPATPVVNRAQAPGSFTAVQIPATLTIRTTTPASQPRAKTVPPAPGPQPSTSPRAIPINTQTKIVTVKAGEGNLDVQNLMSFMNSVSLPAMGQPQTFVVMSNQKTNGAGSAAVHTAAPSAHNSIVQVTSAAPSSHTCPRCGAKFKMIEALRGHMCFCCPDMPRTTNTDAPATKPQIIQTKSLSMPVKMERMDLSLSEPQSRIVMLVDDFYYGTYEGNRVYVPSDNLKEPISFKCLTCGKKLKNNIRLMNHMKFHVDVEQQTGEVASHTSCPHCFRQFPTPFRLQCHVESVHNALESTTRCKICEWAFDSEPVFLQHMKNTHKPGEMPYVCQVCQYRSSFYSDVHNHFRTWHEDTRYLLCIYCLKVFKHSSTYQQHFSRHQNATVYNCNKCRLQFLFTKEKVEHKVNHHKTFRKPSQLEGLQAGTKVTIRAYAAQKKMAGQMSSKPSREPTNTERDIRTAQFGQTSSAHTLNTKLLSPQSTTAGKKQVSKMYDYLVKFQEHRALLGRQKCVECTFDIPDFANHYPTYVHCSLCAYSTCCSRAYANHMINNHVPGRTQRGRSKKGSLSWLNLTCACCNYKTNQGDLMAKHLVQYPDHYYCVFFMKGNPKIGFVEPKRECTQPALDSKNVPRSSSVDESATSLEVSSVQDEDLDQELAPLEESDSDFETDDSSQQEPLTIEDEQTVSETTAKPGSPKTNKEREETLSVRQLRILLFALCSGVEKAAKDMDTRPQLIRAWLRDKEKRLDREGRSGEAVERLVEWVLVQREQQSIINEKNLFQKASEVHSQTNQSSSFRISYEWAVCFMLQHKLGLQSLALPTCQLPRGLEENCHHFTGFVQRQIQMHNVPRSAVGAMDELSIFVDFDTLVDGSITSKEAAFQLEGTGKPWVNIYLALLADGAMLPTVLFFKGTPFGSFSKRLPDSLLLEARVEGFSENEELDIWNARVWQQHLNSQKGSKTILVMDGHHSHMSEGFVSTMSGTKTLPVIIPSGCTSKLQPLEICVRPVLKKFLLARWSQLTTQGCVAEVTPEELVRLLVTWLEEFLACCSSKPELTQYSFCLSRVIAEQEECIKEANTQVALINTLTEAMLGPEAVDSEPLSEEESVETLAEGAMETSKNVTGEESPGTAKEDVQQTGTKRDSQTRDEGRTETEVSENEQQAQKMVNKGLEASSETSETCSSLLPHVFPQSPASTQVSEKEDLLGPSEACQDSGVTQTDAGFSS
uniref:Pogo transposable element derived with ZNF domain b n=1 Tax=Pygocentrus nattereri TaxID=42514 RepID=A0A3B4D3M3_PYGNA